MNQKTVRHTRGRRKSEGAAASGRPLQRSRFAHLFQRDGVFCLMHSLTRRMFFGGQLLADLYEAFATRVSSSRALSRCATNGSKAPAAETIESLRESGILIESPEEDARAYGRCFRQALSQYPIHHMYLLPTSECNFRCRYCFVEDDQRPMTPCHMDTATAELAIRTFAKISSGNGRSSVTFYGGEPLLNAPTTFFALRLLRRLESEGLFPQGLDISVLTNGSRIDDDAVRVFQETRPGIGVSIDGPRELHDAARKDAGGAGTFDAAMRGFRRLQESGLNPSVSCTLNALTIHHMDEIVDFIIHDLRPRGMGFNLLLPRAGESACTSLDHAFASRELIRAFEKLRRAGIYEDRMMRRIRPYAEGRVHFKDCMGVGGQIVVGPSGRVGPCQALLGLDDRKYFPLDIRDLANTGPSLTSETVYDNPLFDEWRQRFPFNMAECAECAAISVCGGGCPYAAGVVKGSIWEIDDRVCFQAKNILEWMIWDTYANMNSGDGELRPQQS